MWPLLAFVWEIIKQAADITVHSTFSTSYPAILRDLAVAGYVLLRIFRRGGGIAAVMKHVDNVKDAGVALVAAFVLTFLYHLFLTVPDEIGHESTAPPVVSASISLPENWSSRAGNGQTQEKEKGSEVLALIAKANADDANAFDELVSIRDKETPDQQALIKTAIADREAYARENLDPGQVTGSCGFSPSGFREELQRPDRAHRKRAIAGCDPLVAAADNSARNRPQLEQMERMFPEIDLIAPRIVDVALHDPSLSVRAQAVNTTNLWFRGAPGVPLDGFDLLETGALSEWWKQNEANYKTLILLSRANFYISENLSSVTLYDEIIQQLVPHATPPLKKALGASLAQMRSDAGRPLHTELLARLKKETSCARVARDIEGDLPNWDPDDIQLNRGERDQLAFLATCAIDEHMLPLIAAYAAKTHVLNARYWAVMIVNKLAGATLDPFNTSDIHNWWEKHNTKDK